MIRIIAGIVGLILVGSAAHGTILASGGYDQPTAIITIALALGVAVGAAAIGTAAGHGRVTLAIAIGLGLAAGEAYALLSTSERVIASREAAQAVLRDAKQRHDLAAKRLLDAQTELKKSQEAPATSARELKAQAALDTAVTAIRDQAALLGCKENCRQLLTAQAADARKELDAAQAEAAAAVKEQRQSAETAVVEAEKAVFASPVPASATPLADRIGAQPWLLDIIAAALLSLGVNGLGAALIALAAHGHAKTALPAPMSTPAAAAETRLPGEPKAKKLKVAAEVVSLPPAIGRVARFVGHHLEATESGRIEVGELYKGYRAWCTSSNLKPLDVYEFGDQLSEPLELAGIRLQAVKDKVYLVGVGLRAA